MTILEALTSLTEYDNDNLLSKVLLDCELTGTDTYVSDTHKAKLDLCAADIYEHIATQPDFSESKLSIKYDKKSLLIMARKLRKKHGVQTANISGKSRW